MTMTQYGQQISNLGIVGTPLVRTSYGDGYDVGTILTYDPATPGSDHALDPHFALVVERDGDDILILTMGEITRPDGIDATSGIRRPSNGIVNIPLERRNVVRAETLSMWPVPFGIYVSASLADGSPILMGCELLPWDGKPVRYRKA